MQPITLYTVPPGPNPWKVAIVLRELGLPYEHSLVAVPDLKKPVYTHISPNGRTPAIRDPNNNDIILWESGAIIEYLIDRYDKNSILTYMDETKGAFIKQWVFFQASGQGPYYGQAAWFKMFHPEKLPSAQKRYNDEAKRVVGVLEEGLKRNGTGWLVGDKCTYADLSFLMWNMMMQNWIEDFSSDDYPNFKSWHESMLVRPSVKNVLEEKALLMGQNAYH